MNTSQFKEAWFNGEILKIVDRSTGKEETFHLVKTEVEPRIKYDGDLDTEEYFGCNGFKRMRKLELCD